MMICKSTCFTDAFDLMRALVSKEYTTAESYVILEPSGERSILMASGSTSQITREVSSSC